MIVALAHEGGHFRAPGMDIQWPAGGGARQTAEVSDPPPDAVAKALARGQIVILDAPETAPAPATARRRGTSGRR